MVFVFEIFLVHGDYNGQPNRNLDQQATARTKSLARAKTLQRATEKAELTKNSRTKSDKDQESDDETEEDPLLGIARDKRAKAGTGTGDAFESVLEKSTTQKSQGDSKRREKESKEAKDKEEQKGF